MEHLALDDSRPGRPPRGETRETAASPARSGCALVAAVVLLALGTPAAADPIVSTPVLGSLSWGGPEDAAVAGVLVEARMLGVAGGYRLTTWPDRQLGLDPGMPAIVALRAGGAAHLQRVPFDLVLRVDAAELLRPSVADRSLVDGPVGEAIGRLVDDAYGSWRPTRAASVLAGRARVPFSKLRQYDEVDLPLGCVPFIVDRIAPDRRTGVTLFGDLGSLAYAAGAYEDLDALEARPPVTDPVADIDPSQDGQLAVVGHLEWTPVAPMMGSNPPGKIGGARGPLPTPPVDPWYGTLRTSIGLGVLWRHREAGGDRVDSSLSVQLKWRRLALVTETILSRDEREELDGQALFLGAHGEAMVAITQALSVHVRGEVDPGAGADGELVGAGGLTWHVTTNRRNKVALLGWLRRDLATDAKTDGVVVALQASL